MASAKLIRKEAAGAQEGQAAHGEAGGVRPRDGQAPRQAAGRVPRGLRLQAHELQLDKLRRVQADARPRIAHRIQEIRDAAAQECRWELQDAAAPLFEVLDGALPIFRRQAAEGSINGDARLAITESVKLLNDMFGVDGAKAAMAEAGVTIVDDLG